MDFNDTAEEAVYRRQVRAFLDANAIRGPVGVQGFGAGHDDPALRESAKKWQAKMADAGFAGIALPKEWGGQGGSPIQQVIFNQEEASYQVPRGFFNIGLGMAVPTIGVWGTAEQRSRYITSALRADDVWCQLFSEPGSGSDLAGLRTRAELEGDEWIINGQKIWATSAAWSDYGLLVARTDPKVPKHEGLTCFCVPMASPGVEVRPIRQMSGNAEFNEVFLTNVRLSDAERIGPVGKGWKVALTTLMNERYQATPFGPGADDLLQLAREVLIGDRPALHDKAVRDKIADWYVRSQGMKYTRFRTMTSLSRGATPGPESSIGKLVNAPMVQEISAYALDLIGAAGAIVQSDEMPMKSIFQDALFYSVASRIAGGTDEIMRNVIAERVLNLPADVRVDKGIPFTEVPTGITS